MKQYILGIIGIIAVIALGAGALTYKANTPDNYVFRVLNRTKGHAGTGFFLQTKKGIIAVTNAHVCDERPFRLVGKNSNEELIDLSVIAVDYNADLCFMAVNNPVGAFKLSETLPIKKDKLYSMGFTKMEPMVVRQYSLVGRDTQMINYPPFFCGGFPMCFIDLKVYELSVPPVPGNSGSPLLNEDGDVVGVIVAQMGYMGYAVPLEVLQVDITALEQVLK